MAVTFESYERRIEQIKPVMAKYKRSTTNMF